jgi:hypothetical protein
VNWALASLIAFIVITAGLFVAFSFMSAGDDEMKTPSDIERR